MIFGTFVFIDDKNSNYFDKIQMILIILFVLLISIIIFNLLIAILSNLF